jgi:chromosomal replication initiator protein
MKSSARSRKLTLPRQIAMYLARELTSLSLPDIGRYFGGRDHTTVIHACRKVERTQATDKQLREKLIHIRELIKA